MRKTLITLGLGVLLAAPAFAATTPGSTPVQSSKRAHRTHRIAEGDKPAGEVKPAAADGVKSDKPMKTKKVKKSSKKVEGAGDVKPAEGAK